MQNVNVSFFLCEDLRWEQNGGPMFIGVMAPNIHPAEYPLKLPVLYAVTMFRADADVNELNAILSLNKIRSGSDEIEEMNSYSSYHKREDEEGEWLVVSTLPIHDLELVQGDKILFNLEFNGKKQSLSLTASTPIHLNTE